MRWMKLILMSAMLVGMGIAFATPNFEAVQTKILEKANVEHLQLRSDQGNIVLEGQTALLKDKVEAEKIAEKQLKQEVVNDIVVVESRKTDQEITLDVIGRIQSLATGRYVFNDLNVETHSGNVILTGKVRDAYLSDISQKAATEVSGVRSVNNRIEILPPSSADDRLRVAIYNRLTNDDRLFQYFLSAQPSINIIVEHARVTLNGFVNTKSDRVQAGLVAQGMFGVLSVDNRLQVQ